MQDEARAGAALREADPVKWFVGTIAAAAGELPSKVKDEALLTKVILSERSMDPIVHTEVRHYLRSKGFSWISGCFG